MGRLDNANDVRASDVRLPKRSPALEKAQAERSEYVRGREAIERRSVVRGLVVLVVVVLVFSFARAGLHRVFVSGWWRQW